MGRPDKEYMKPTWYESLPKIELHVHLEGAIPHEALFDLMEKYGGDPAVPDVTALERRFQYRDFAQFIEAWSWKNQFLREYEDFAHIAERTARSLAEQNIRYAEMFFSPSIFARRGLEVRALTRAVRTGLSAVPEVEVALVADLVRDYGPEAEMRTLMELNEVRALGVVGIGIGGSEHEYPPAPFEPLYREARRLGFHTTAHAGEAAGPESIWGAIRHLQVERIGHGTRASEDDELVRYLAREKIPLEVCLTSNVRTGVVGRLCDHPIRRYFEQGIIVSVNTDDPKMFGTSLAEEYRLLEQELGFSREEICRLILLGIESSWLSADRKESLAASFKEAPSWVGR